MPLHRRSVLLGGAGLAAGCAAAAEPSQDAFVWEHKLISSNGNFPDFRSNTAANESVLAALHARQSPPSDDATQEALAALRQRGFVAEVEGRLLPAVAVIGLADGARAFAVGGAVARETAALVLARYDDVRAQVMALPSFARLAFEDISLLVLSNVLLDNWQINHVESRWLNAERPQRSGGRYYFAMMARAEASDLEAFGIYGNQMAVMGDTLVCTYGNRRLSAASLTTLLADEIAARFGQPVRAGALAARFVSVARGEGAFTPEERAGFASLGMIGEDGAPRIPVMTEADYEALNAIAATMTEALVEILNAHRPSLERRYRASRYAEEISFNEYLIWWYHFFYSAVTDRLIAAGRIQIPSSGLANYIIAG